MESMEKRPFGLQLGPTLFSLVSLLIILAGSYLVWAVFGDPHLAVWKLYPQPFGVVLFWSILFTVYFGFMGQLWGLSHLKQPLQGLVWVLLTTVLAVVTVVALLYGYGSLDPAFDLAKGGYTSAAMIVLIGFYTWGILGTGMAHWPWVDLGLKQPWVGIAEFFVGFFLTFLGYIVLIYPNLASWASPERTVLPLTTVIGWFYCVIVSWLTTFLIFENWPWTAFGSRGNTAVASVVGNFILGTAIYFVFLYLLKGFLVPQEAQAKLGGAINLWPAQLGVCVSFWLIAWANVAGNVPTHLRSFANKVTRFIITYGLAFVTFVVYTRWFAIGVLHEAEISPGFGGDPLTWADLMIYVMLIYVIYFGSYGLTKRAQN